MTARCGSIRAPEIASSFKANVPGILIARLLKHELYDATAWQCFWHQIRRKRKILQFVAKSIDTKRRFDSGR